VWNFATNGGSWQQFREHLNPYECVEKRANRKVESILYETYSAAKIEKNVMFL